MKETVQGRGLRVLSVVCYVLAGIVFLLGVVVVVSFITTASRLGAGLGPLSILGLEVLLNVFLPPIRHALISIGIVLFVISILLGSLFYAVGRLLGIIRLLLIRVAHLEAQTGRSYTS
jgi:hypothetical protein